jgi:hypothetical protein
LNITQNLANGSYPNFYLRLVQKACYRINLSLVLKDYSGSYFPAAGWLAYPQFGTFPQKKKEPKKKTLTIITMSN